MKEYNSNFPTYFKAQDTSGFRFDWHLPKTAFHAMTESKVHKQNVLEENIVSVSFTNWELNYRNANVSVCRLSYGHVRVLAM